MSSILAVREAAASGTADAAPRHHPPSELWVLAALIAAILSGAMPTFHVQAVGLGRLQDAGVQYVRELRGSPLTAREETAVRRAVRGQSPAVAGGVSFIAGVLAVVVGGVVLAVAVTLVGADLSAGHTLAAAAAGHAAAVLMRAAAWAVAMAFHGPEVAAAVDWLHVAPVSLGSLFVVPPGGIMASLLHAADFTLFGATVIVAMLLHEWDEDIGAFRAAVAASAFPLVVVAWRLTVSLSLGVPIG